MAYYGKVESGEFDTRSLLRKILENKRLFLPKSAKREIKLDIYQIENLDADLEKGLYDIMEPIPSKSQKVSISLMDLVIVPGSVFDESGGRYGFGAGYYDSLLENYNGIKVALALDFTVMKFKLKLQPHDIKMDYIITEKKIYDCENFN